MMRELLEQHLYKNIINQVGKIILFQSIFLKKLRKGYSKKMKKVSFYTLGCKVNQYETNAMDEEVAIVWR